MTSSDAKESVVEATLSSDPDEYTDFISKDNLNLSNTRNRLTLYCGLLFFVILPQCLYDTDSDSSVKNFYLIALWLALANSFLSLIALWRFPRNKLLSLIISILWVAISILGLVSIILLSDESDESSDCSSADSFLISYFSDVLISTDDQTQFECLEYFLGRQLIWISLAFVVGTDMHFNYGENHIWRLFSQLMCISLGGWFEWYFVLAFTEYPPLDGNFTWDVTDTGYWLLLLSALIFLLFYCLLPLIFKQHLQTRFGWFTSSVAITMDAVGCFLLVVGASLSTANPVLNIAVLNTQYIYIVLCVVVACEIFNISFLCVRNENQYAIIE